MSDPKPDKWGYVTVPLSGVDDDGDDNYATVVLRDAATIVEVEGLGHQARLSLVEAIALRDALTDRITAAGNVEAPAEPPGGATS